MANIKSILIVEDNDLNRAILTYMLEDSYKVLSAKNGAEGLEILNENAGEIALILLDIQMPVMNGYEFLEAVRAEGTHIDIPIIVTTAGDTVEAELRCLDLGAADFVTKPYNPEIVKKRAESLIRLREMSVLLHKVERDEQSGMYNRESFFTYTARRLAENPDEQYDMVCLEIESFRLLHDRYGDEKCDAFVRMFTKNMLMLLPDDVLAGRIDEDKFAVLQSHIPFEHHQAYMDMTKHGTNISPIPNVKINCGVYADVDHSLNVATIVTNAYLPIEGIRHRYDKNLAQYDNALRERIARAQILINDAPEAIAEKQLKVYYQPKLDAQKGCIGGAEALIRWVHPKLGFLSPAEFIPVFESNGFVYEIDKFILRGVCEDLRRWIDEGKKVVPVSINISQADFDRTDLAYELGRIVDDLGIPHELIHFEITESVNVPDKIWKYETVCKMSANGFSVELDDFGTGYSTFASLGEIPIDTLKIDSSLIGNMFEDKYYAILRGVLYTASNLNMKVVVEGVETKEQENELKRMCRNHLELYIQGYYYAKPLPVDEFEQYLV